MPPKKQNAETRRRTSAGSVGSGASAGSGSTSSSRRGGKKNKARVKTSDVQHAVKDEPERLDTNAGTADTGDEVGAETNAEGEPEVEAEPEAEAEPEPEPEADQIDPKLVEKMKKLFIKLDADASGSLSSDELRTGLTKVFKGKISDEALEAMILEADADGDGEVDYEEFMNMMQHRVKEDVVELAEGEQGPVPFGQRCDNQGC
jgi:hypothetical protein